MTLTDTLAEAVDRLTHSDLRGIVVLTRHRHGPLHRWLFVLATNLLTGGNAPDFAPWGWQTVDLRDSLVRLGILSKLAGPQLANVRELFRAMTDVCLVDLQDRRAL